MNNTLIPIVVDLDDTLARTDFFFESFLLFIKQNPLNFFRTIIWLLTKDKSYLKSRIAEVVDIDATLIPYNKEVKQWLENKKSDGHQIILATASHIKYANAVANHLGIFNRVLATEHGYNLKGINKEKKLVELFGKQGFTYVGDSQADIEVWRSAKSAVVVSTSEKLLQQVKSLTSVEKIISVTQPSNTLFRAIRIHQWVKNTLIFVPLLTSHNLDNFGLFILSIIAFLAFSFCASGVYILNDFFDIASDRQHNTKCNRPFASGQLSIINGGLIFSVCLFVSVILCVMVGVNFLLIMMTYFFISLLYSLFLKFKMMLDIIILAGLYSIRIIAGAIAINVDLSFWLLAFSMFIFLSLAIMKRHSELFAMKKAGKAGSIQTRGYFVDDLNMLAILGSASGYISVLVMALYVNSLAQVKLYSHPDVLWVVCPVLLFWMGRTWLYASRGMINEDPILYVIKDKTSWLTGLIVIILFVMAS